MAELRFDGKVAVVTGAGAGLGREYALLFASRGAKVIVNDLGGSMKGEGNSRSAADIVVDEIRAKGGVAVADYNSVVDGEKIVKTALEAFGRIDILVNNAGILRDRSFLRISDEDWNIIQDVHLKGSFKTSQAAFAIMKKQNFGRIIMTSSNSGVYGNFGQANYSAAKMGLVGLANTIAIEGAKYNIHCNVIVPTAASRLTEGIIPEVLFNELKPQLIAPVVVYMCHDSCSDNGAVIESAAGWATKIHYVRGRGSLLRSSIGDSVSPEKVRDIWGKITDMSKSEHLNAIGEASMKLLGKLEHLKENPTDPNKRTISDDFSYNSRDLILYALGVGTSVTDKSDLKLLYEGHPDFTYLPAFFIQPGLILSMQSGLVSEHITHTDVDLANILHGEQYMEFIDTPVQDGTLNTVGSVVEVLDKKSGAVVVANYDSYDPEGKHIIRAQSSVFVVGAGNFGGKREASSAVIPALPVPNRKPDYSAVYKTTADQAAIYRLSGDYNPLHIDPDFSAIAGFKIPILHGLCTLGISLRLVLKRFANSDASLFKAVKARFAKPVIPGQTLQVDMWQNGNRIHFSAKTLETGKEVLSHSYVDLKMVKINLTSGEALQSDAVFARIKEGVAENPEKAKSVNAIFAYKITQNGKVAKEWTLDLKNLKVYEGPSTDKVDTTLTVSDADMVDIATGTLNPQQAFMKGKLKITGNLMLTQKLVPLLKTNAKL